MKYSFSLHLLCHQVCLCGFTNNYHWNSFFVISWEWLVTFTSNLASSSCLKCIPGRSSSSAIKNLFICHLVELLRCPIVHFMNKAWNFAKYLSKLFIFEWEVVPEISNPFRCHYDYIGGQVTKLLISQKHIHDSID